MTNRITLSIDGNAETWQAFLEALADEAQNDASATDVQFALHNTLRDLSLVARAYATRIAMDRGTEVKQPAAAVAPAEPTLEAGLEAPLGGAAPEAQIPGWLLDALADANNRIGALEARVEALEQNQQLNFITPDRAYLVEAENEDIDPAAWDNIDRARAALRGIVAREHRRLTQVRQQLLSRVVSLAREPERNSEIDAEIRQHETRAQELGETDAIAGRKMDEIAAIDDLDQARDYATVAREGWPE